MDAPKDHQNVVTIDVHAAKNLLNSSDYRYLDVRSVEEFNKSHAENAYNVPYMFITEAGRVKNPDFVEQVAAICENEDHLIVACNSGGRSLRASVDLLDSGFKHVVNMGGGYSAWVDAGFAGDKPPEELKTSCKIRR
ncbi:protein HIGH ARSENIC CONTENT 1, mitochondrial isoform X2 [Vigna radiata var. radiata]|uniref:Protein HIGH ARSENIC CONTENT 1, mitochondrial isoform X2 n=1 Tax=Vigna radiata var. radiata TaxID=3916 RepID=A0A1S3VZ59_VIGRR|nr:protein HIGH ARSENIC CONTENT 1, mitochondrial isoform X2 [Vigna radiata var. radiata]